MPKCSQTSPLKNIAMEYKYTTTFQAPLISCEISEASLISKASLEKNFPLFDLNINLYASYIKRLTSLIYKPLKTRAKKSAVKNTFIYFAPITFI